jgi:hypothetical protein
MLGLGQAAVIIAPVISFCYSGSDYENLFEPMSTDEGAKPGMTLKGLPFQKTYFTHVLFRLRGTEREKGGRKKKGWDAVLNASRGMACHIKWTPVEFMGGFCNVNGPPDAGQALF